MTRKRILFIDGDEDFVREQVAAAAQRGFETLATASSSDGVELARTERPDLIFVSVELAPTNGWSVCTKLKKDDELKSIPVVLTSSTSTADTFEKHKKLKTRADEYLLKPYDTEELLRVAGSLVGLPDVAADEELVVEDESLSLGEFDQGALDEQISIEGDEPLAVQDEAVAGDAAFDAVEGETSLDAVEGEAAFETGGDPALDALADEVAFDPRDGIDPLAADSGEELVAEDLPDAGELAAADELAVAEELGEESLELADEPLEAAPAPGGDALDELDAFDRSFESLTPPPSADALEAPAPADDADAAFDASFDAATGGDEIVVADENADEFGALDDLPPLAGAEGEAEQTFSDEELSFEEAPLEVPAETVQVGATGDELGSASFDAGEPYSTAAFDTEGPLASDASAERVGELEARVAELEAELEGYRQTESGRDEEIERLRTEGSRRDRELLDLRAQLNEKDRQIFEAKDAESRATAELSKANAEKARRDATLKALTVKGEQTAQLAKKLQVELAAAREEVKGGAALKAKVAELDAAKQAAADAAVELESLREQLQSAQSQLDEARADLDAARGEADGLRSDLDEARKTAERALANAVALQEKLASADERARELDERVVAGDERARRVREALMNVIEAELG